MLLGRFVSDDRQVEDADTIEKLDGLDSSILTNFHWRLFRRMQTYNSFAFAHDYRNDGAQWYLLPIIS